MQGESPRPDVQAASLKIDTALPTFASGIHGLKAHATHTVQRTMLLASWLRYHGHSCPCVFHGSLEPWSLKSRFPQRG
jgi:hypothetical protein